MDTTAKIKMTARFSRQDVDFLALTQQGQSLIQLHRGPPELELTEAVYEKLADETLDALAEYFEDLADESFTAAQDYDVVFSLNCPPFFRKFLQVPHILYFSRIFCIFDPFPTRLYDFEMHLFTLRTTEGFVHDYHKSGPKRYDWTGERWVYAHDGMALHDLLSKEFSAIFQSNIDLSHLLHS